jgi:hypothetical protein
LITSSGFPSDADRDTLSFKGANLLIEKST